MPSLGRHSRPPLRHCEHRGFCSSPTSPVSRGTGEAQGRAQTLKLASPACQARYISNGAIVAMQATYQPVRERIPGKGVDATCVGETRGVEEKPGETCGEAPDPGRLTDLADSI
jgi:hypothetical protein